MFIWADPARIIMTMMIRLLKDWLDWKHNFGSCSIPILLLLVTVSLKLLPEVYCQPQHYQYDEQQLAQNVMPKVSRGLRSWDKDNSYSGGISGSNGYFLLQKFARPLQQQYLQSFNRQGLNDYDGVANLQEQSPAGVVSDGILQRSLSPSKHFVGDIPQIPFNCEGQGSQGGWDKECTFYGGPKSKRSIGLDDAGLGPIRVFKYISEDQQSLSGDNSVRDVGTKAVGNSKQNPKKTKTKSQYYADLKSSTVTDRSLIPNSYFGSAPESQKNNQTDNQVQDQPTVTPTPATTRLNGTSTPYAFINSTDENDPNNAGSKMPSAKAYKQIRENISQDEKLSKNAEFLLYNASLSERSRRSPFRNPHYQPIMYQPRFIPQQRLQGQHLQRQQQQQQHQQRISQIQHSNRAVFLPPNAAQNQAFQMSRFASVPNVNKMQIQQYPNLKLTVPPVHQPKKHTHDIQPSSSNDYFNYRPSPQTLPYNTDPNIQEPSWNHPMYRRYSKVAKRVQNKVSGVLGNFGKSQGGSHHSRRDFPNNKGRPIPLPRPKPSNNKGRRIRSRNRHDSNGNIRYSYPKSAQNIQDILNHFQRDNNEIMDSMAKPTKASPFGGSGNGRGGPGSISDLSSELDDVRFSLLRDIREFSKRPNDLSQHDDDSSGQSHHRKRPPFYSEDHIKNAYRENESKSYHSNPPNNNEEEGNPNRYQIDDGYDEMSDPKPKPVRDMVKSSSRFREESKRGDRDSSSSREKEFQHSKKRDRDPHFRDRDEDSTERYPNNNRDQDRYKNDRPIRHPNSGERHRPRVRDREHSYSKERPKRLRTKFSHRDSDDFNSFEVRNSNSQYRPILNKRNKELMDYPNSIRDKIREVSGEFDRHTNKIIRDPSSPIYRPTNKPIVIKRPYESYRIPPTMMNANFEIPKKSSEQQQQEYNWNNFASATEKNLYGYNPKLVRPTPLIISSPTGGYTPRYGGGYNNPTPSIRPEDEDVLEIHTGGGQPNNIGPADHALKEKSLHKAYMDLLQHKMQAESALLNTPHALSPSTRGQQAKPKKAPMRMKIHIYPNNEAGVGVTEMTSHNFNTFGNHQQMNYGGSSGYSESHPSNMLIAPRDSQKIGGSLRSPHQGLGPGPVPPTLIGYGNSNNFDNNRNNKPSISSSNSDNNKNLVLHLHVHRRNDVGPVEMEAEASETHTSTAKPLTYKDIFDGHHQEQQEDQQIPVGDPAEPDKSVSMEVPIHDDKIEDVLHTLLQFRDRGSSRKKRNHAAGADEVT